MTFVVCWWHLQTVWPQIRQIPEGFFCLKKQQTIKSMQKYQACKEHEKQVYIKVNVLKIFLFSNKMLGLMAGIHKMLVRIANREDLCVCAVCLWLFDRHLVFKILEHLLNIYCSPRTLSIWITKMFLWSCLVLLCCVFIFLVTILMLL